MTDLESLKRALAKPVGDESPLPDLTIRAADAGLLDIAYATLDSPVGALLLARTPRGLVRLAYLDGAEDDVLSALASRVSPRVLRAPKRLDEERRELEEYFRGRRTVFEFPVDWALTRGFARRVLQATARIPYGSVSSYGQIAAGAGSPRAHRAAGTALSHNPIHHGHASNRRD